MFHYFRNNGDGVRFPSYSTNHPQRSFNETDNEDFYELFPEKAGKALEEALENKKQFQRLEESMEKDKLFRMQQLRGERPSWASNVIGIFHGLHENPAFLDSPEKEVVPPKALKKRHQHPVYGPPSHIFGPPTGAHEDTGETYEPDYTHNRLQDIYAEYYKKDRGRNLALTVISVVNAVNKSPVHRPFLTQHLDTDTRRWLPTDDIERNVEIVVSPEIFLSQLPAKKSDKGIMGQTTFSQGNCDGSDIHLFQPYMDIIKKEGWKIKWFTRRVEYYYDREKFPDLVKQREEFEKLYPNVDFKRKVFPKLKQFPLETYNVPSEVVRKGEQMSLDSYLYRQYFRRQSHGSILLKQVFGMFTLGFVVFRLILVRQREKYRLKEKYNYRMNDPSVYPTTTQAKRKKKVFENWLQNYWSDE
jgi:hypothetical protein